MNKSLSKFILKIKNKLSKIEKHAEAYFCEFSSNQHLTELTCVNQC